MSLRLLDASVLLASEDAGDENHDDARRLLRGAHALSTIDLAYYEVTNVAVRSWRDEAVAERLRLRVAALADDGGLTRVDPALLSATVSIAAELGISVYDAAYVAAAERTGAILVSCDVRDLVSRGLAVPPAAAL
ncbi:PIN domain-containing protein [Microbacterium sp.]|uniref:PIN domain-containing protein n=1 Tax=Microbacterium sp. TaxID=51671 RepID=UPI003C736D77